MPRKKEPLLPHPLHSTVVGKGGGSAFSAALKICLTKPLVVALALSSKAHFY
jgi:hypothetical protein